MKKDIESAKKLEADGVVFGILKANGEIDTERNKELVHLARPMKVTCHRAFDMTNDPYKALEACIAAGFDRILTSGQQANVYDGRLLLAGLVKKAGIQNPRRVYGRRPERVPEAGGKCGKSEKNPPAGRRCQKIKKAVSKALIGLLRQPQHGFTSPKRREAEYPATEDTHSPVPCGEFRCR